MKKWYKLNNPKMLKSWEKYRLKKRAFIYKLKDNPCKDCKRKYHPWQMHFDHRDPKTKRYTLSKLGTASEKLILSEVSKCDLVCANCHADRTYKGIKNGTISIFGL